MLRLHFGRKTLFPGGLLVIDAYLSKQAFPYCAFGCLLNLPGAFRKSKYLQTSLFHSSFVFLCFNLSTPCRFFFFFSPVLFWPDLFMSLSLELQYPGTIQRTEPFFCFRGSGSRHQVAFRWRVSYMFFTKTTKQQINKTTIIKRQPTQHFFSFFLKLDFTFCAQKQFTGKVKLLCHLQLFFLHGD